MKKEPARNRGEGDGLVPGKRLAWAHGEEAGLTHGKEASQGPWKKGGPELPGKEPAWDREQTGPGP